MSGASLIRVLAFVRTATAGLAIAVALLLLFRIPLLGTFRAALVILAAMEVLAFGRSALARGAGARDWAEIAVKLAVLGGALFALSS